MQGADGIKRRMGKVRTEFGGMARPRVCDLRCLKWKDSREVIHMNIKGTPGDNWACG